MNRPAFLTFTRLFMNGAQKPKSESVTLEIEQITKVTEWEISYYEGTDIVEVDSCQLWCGRDDNMIVEGTVAETQRALTQASLRTHEDPQLERIAEALERLVTLAQTIAASQRGKGTH
jgi:hypothetical protein